MESRVSSQTCSFLGGSFSSTILIVALVLFSAFNCYALTIDEFNEDGQVKSSSISIPDTENVTSDAIGGGRYMYTVKTSGFLASELKTEGGLLSHTNEAGTGTSRVVWDGDNLDSFDATGLGGIDLTKDGTGNPAEDGFVLKIFLIDGSTPVTLRIRAYSDNTKVSQHERVINSPINWPSYSGSDVEIKFLFKDFVRLGSQTVDFTNIGALELEIEQTTVATDVMITSFMTNGCSNVVPTPTSEYNDQCGVLCGTNACFDCKSVPNGTDLPGTSCDTGQLGVCAAGIWTGPTPSCTCNRVTNPVNEICDALDNNCDGSVDETFTTLGDTCSIGSGVCEIFGAYECNNAGGVQCSVADQQSNVDSCEGSKGCDGVPNSGLTEDACGVCGGDGQSCADCTGTPNGTTEIDRCGICGGDGQTCVECDSNDITDIQASLDGTTKQQENLIKSISKRIKRATNAALKAGTITRRERRKARNFARSARIEAVGLSDAGWQIVWTQLPSTFLTCTNSFCISTSNAGAVSSFLDINRELENLGLALSNSLKFYANKSGNRRLKRNANRGRRTNESLASLNEVTADSVPLTVSNCDIA